MAKLKSAIVMRLEVDCKCGACSKDLPAGRKCYAVTLLDDSETVWCHVCRFKAYSYTEKITIQAEAKIEQFQRAIEVLDEIGLYYPKFVLEDEVQKSREYLESIKAGKFDFMNAEPEEGA